MKKYEYIAKTFEDAKEKAIKELKIKEKEAYFYEEEEASGLFKGKKAKVTVILKSEILEYSKEFIKEMINKMGIEANLEAKIREDSINLNIISDSNAILIGKNGRIVDSMQILLRSSIQNKTGFRTNVLVDVGSYKEQKNNDLEYRVQRMAEDVKRTGMEIKLDPMNSYERRIVHNVCNSVEGIITESNGEEPFRYIVIKLKD